MYKNSILFVSYCVSVQMYYCISVSSVDSIGDPVTGVSVVSTAVDDERAIYITWNVSGMELSRNGMKLFFHFDLVK